MDSALPEPGNQPERISFRKGPSGPSDGDGFGTGAQDDVVEVGEFRQGSQLSRWALARYLVGRAIGESVGRSLLIVGVLMLAGAGLIWWAGGVFWAILIIVLALGVLLLRTLMLAVLRRLTATGPYAPLEDRLRALVSETRGDVLSELRRIGLPGRTWTLPLLGLRLMRRSRRKDTVARMRTFELDRAVPKSRLDELHLLLQSAVGRTASPGPGARSPSPWGGG